ncbi:TonB family protein [Rugamonas rubra]|uniref:TonB family C-terminal domain-containing protein n=1 Tax=Rugamonas rubra TaxID=758825 RepID=A0A1I4M1Z0_9BURK|nr:TonB family C-terminal domain-containing protein [Rugamonas rubra]
MTQPPHAPGMPAAPRAPAAPATPPAGEAHAARLLRWGYTALGVLMVALGVIGALLPVMPTTIFLILALACFSRASPRLEQRLLQHPRFGAPLRQWREHRAVSKRGKRMACLGMALGFIVMCLGRPPWPAVVLVGLVELAVLVYLLRRPEGPPADAGAIDSASAGATVDVKAKAATDADAAAEPDAAANATLLAGAVSSGANSAAVGLANASTPAFTRSPRPLAAAGIVAAHCALLAWILYGHAQESHVVAAAPQAERAMMLVYLPAAAPPKPLEQRQADHVSAEAKPTPAPQQAPRETPPTLQAAPPQPKSTPLPPTADAPPVGAIASSAPRAAPPADTASLAAAPPSPALPPAPQEVRSGANSWEGKVLARMERFRRYPTAARARGEEGVVTLRCRVNRDGQVLSAAIEQSSGHPLLDQAALETLQRAAPLPRIPDERPAQLDLSIPVQFSVR